MAAWRCCRKARAASPPSSSSRISSAPRARAGSAAVRRRRTSDARLRSGMRWSQMRRTGRRSLSSGARRWFSGRSRRPPTRLFRQFSAAPRIAGHHHLRTRFLIPARRFLQIVPDEPGEVVVVELAHPQLRKRMPQFRRLRIRSEGVEHVLAVLQGHGRFVVLLRLPELGKFGLRRRRVGRHYDFPAGKREHGAGEQPLLGADLKGGHVGADDGQRHLVDRRLRRAELLRYRDDRIAALEGVGRIGLRAAARRKDENDGGAEQCQRPLPQTSIHGLPPSAYYRLPLAPRLLPQRAYRPRLVGQPRGFMLESGHITRRFFFGFFYFPCFLAEGTG